MATNTYNALCKKEDLIYTSCYCEENVWKLLHKIPAEYKKDSYAVFISNDSKTVPIWYQSKSDSISEPVVWDYHVIAIHKSSMESFVYDMDTILEFPTSFKKYYEKALPILKNISKKYHRFYRVVAAKYYLENFASDRSHMIDKQTGKYQAEPPKYDCIKCENSNNNLHEFTTMNESVRHGILMNESQFEKFFS